MSSSAQSYRIEPGQRLAGELSVPGDKSISHRAVMLGGLAAGETVVHGFLDSEDCLATLAAFAQLGVPSRRGDDGSLVISGSGSGSGGLKASAKPLDLGNSGTAMRLMLGLLAGQGIDATLTGDASLRGRPMERVAAPLRAMGAVIATENGHAPVQLKAHSGLHGMRYELPVASAQIKSALLLAGLGAHGVTEVISPAPSRDHTERMLKATGVPVNVSTDGLTVSLAGPARPNPLRIEVPGDLSSAAFFIVGACLGAHEPVTIRNVGVNATRAGVLTVLRAMGARIEFVNERLSGAEPVADIRVWPGELTGIEVEEALIPLAIDELPVLFVAAAAARGRTVFRGAAELRVKESDRIGAMARALAAIGARVEELDDGMIIDGGKFAGGTVDSAGDHRIAMSFAIAALKSEGPIVVRDTAPVATSFPGFVATAAASGLAIGVSGG
jgi:3-phosphoshikimate 1-carboxyvinyltransferase